MRIVDEDGWPVQRRQERESWQDQADFFPEERRAALGTTGHICSIPNPSSTYAHVRRVVPRPPRVMRVSPAGTSLFSTAAGADEVVDRELAPHETDRVRGVTGTKRGMVSRFSWKSRRRFVQRCHEVSGVLWAWLAMRRVAFVTLTYGKRAPPPMTAKGHLNLWKKNHLFRALDDAFTLWVFELQKRGAPHFHFLLFGEGVLEADFAAWVRDTWIHVAGENGSAAADRRRYAVDVRAPDEDAITAVGLVSYLAKELTKSSQKRGAWVRENTDRLGRFHGIGNRGAYGAAVSEHVGFEDYELGAEEAELVSRRVRVLSEGRMPDGLLHHYASRGRGERDPFLRSDQGEPFLRVGFDALGLPGEYLRTGDRGVLDRVIGASQRHHCSRYGWADVDMDCEGTEGGPDGVRHPIRVRDVMDREDLFELQRESYRECVAYWPAAETIEARYER